MKKIIAFIGIIALFLVGTYAQDVVSLSRNAVNVDFALDAGDTILNTNSLNKVINLNGKQAVQLYSLQVKLDSISGTPAHTTYLEGSHDGTTYAAISNVAWTGGTTDTTFYFTDISTGVAWQHLRIRVAGASSSKSQLTVLSGKVLDKVR